METQKNIEISIQSIIVGILVILLLAAVGVAAWFYSENLSLTTANGQLSEQVDELEGEKVKLVSNVSTLTKQVEDLGGEVKVLDSKSKDLSGQLQVTQSDANFFGDMTYQIAELFDELEENLLATDSNSLTFIDWVYDNAVFYDLETASYKYDQWRVTQEKTDADYWAIDAQVESVVAEIEAYIQ